MDELHKITMISSLNLRTARGKPDRVITEPISFRCSFCDKNHLLGKNAFVMVKIGYCLNGDCREVVLCDMCADVFVDLIRMGPRVLAEATTWERQSRVVRMGAIQEDSFCFNCFSNGKSHVFLKFDDLRTVARSAFYDTKRVCAKCAICYLDQMDRKKELRKYGFPQHVSEVNVFA